MLAEMLLNGNAGMAQARSKVAELKLPGGEFVTCTLCSECRSYAWFALPTGPFTILKPQDQDIGETYEVQRRLATDFEAQKS